MPGPKEPNVIDGFSSVRAVQRAGEAGHARPFKTRPSPERLPGAGKGSGPKKDGLRPPASRIGHTAIPKKNDLACYECGYAFVVQGIIHYPICPKCHCTLTMDNLSIGEPWTGDLRTIGDVEIKPDGVGVGSIVARDIAIEGDAQRCELRATRRLELGRGARFNPDAAHYQDLLIRPGAKIEIRPPVLCRNLSVEGDLRATVFASGTISVKPGGLLRGEVNTAHLTVEDGGGLRATLAVHADAGPPQEARTRKRENQHGDKTRVGTRAGRAH